MNNNLNLINCRYNADGKCTNEEKIEECLRYQERCCVWMKNNIIVDDLKIAVNPEMMSSLKELSQYEPSKHKDDIAMFNHLYFTSLWRRMENGKDVCLEVKQVK